MKRIDTKWVCGECRELHDEEFEAIECCAPAVHEVYLCPDCQGDHYTEAAARRCCQEQAEQKEGRIDYRSLELAGQQRLF